jgi:membrane associated rhomboid family serine protease
MDSNGEPQVSRPPEPVFSAPAPVMVLLAVMLIVHLLRIALPPETDSALVNYFVLQPSVLFGAPFDPLRVAAQLLGHMFLHAGLAHLIINSLWLLAFGAPVARRIGAARFYLFFLLGGLAGAAAHLAVHLQDDIGVLGASGAIAALMGGAFRFALSPPLPFGLPRPLLPLLHPRIVMFSAIWVAVNVIIGLVGAGFMDVEAGIAWEAHLGGYFFGLIFFGFFDTPAAKINRP